MLLPSSAWGKIADTVTPSAFSAKILKQLPFSNTRSLPRLSSNTRAEVLNLFFGDIMGATRILKFCANCGCGGQHGASNHSFWDIFFNQTFRLRAKEITIAFPIDWKKTQTVVKSLFSQRKLDCWIMVPAYWHSELLRNHLGQMAQAIITGEQMHLANCANREDIARRRRLEAKIHFSEQHSALVSSL